MRPNGQLDMTKLIVAFRSFANAREKCQKRSTFHCVCWLCGDYDAFTGINNVKRVIDSADPTSSATMNALCDATIHRTSRCAWATCVALNHIIYYRHVLCCLTL